MHCTHEKKQRMKNKFNQTFLTSTALSPPHQRFAQMCKQPGADVK